MAGDCGNMTSMTGPHRVCIRCAVLVFAAVVGAAGLAVADTVRFVNGTVVDGDVVAARDDGLVVRTPRGEQTLPWETLSAATRFRHQPVFRANFKAVLEGLPAAARTNEPPRAARN